MNIKNHILLIITTVIVLLSVLGCKGDFNDFSDSESINGYRMLTVESDLGGFSFEYPETYKRIGPEGDLDYERPYMYVTLTSPEQSMQLLYPKDVNKLEEVTTSYIPAIISVHVFNTNDSPSVSQNASEQLENALDDWGKRENFKLLERRPLTISEVKGEMVSYVVDWFIPVPRGDEPLLQYYRTAYFDYDGNIWIIEAKSEMGIVEQIKADFDYIIETFKILD